ncbi:DUF2029 domain-containing protein [Modestobacter sp. I12A-02628]|uniref:DUF2029 domain-containing protein n=1 Tax=Goekera deserti TaxID=2497753 RepID=A0A7K3WFX1_9ACTN|nr:DUF2029 domain-containing protein [Goekera deserti]NDI50436.1 DUF2029 domain-containing protein [Goekera deserti]NEL55297.1 DUF2029 domain-containing protein [Goekera deserti]
MVPSWSDRVVAQASEAFGGPWGRHAVTGRALFWTPLRICLLFTVAVLALAWAKQDPCADGNWTGSKQYTHFCYSDTVPLFGLRGLADGSVPYLDSPLEYPVLTGGFMWVAAWVARGYDQLTQSVGVLPAVVPVQSYYVVTCLLLSVCALLTTRAVLGLAGRRPWDAAMVGLSPLLFVHAFTNWDLFAVALSTLGLWAWARRRPALAGVLIGLGVAAKLYPVLLLGVLLVLCLRAGMLRAWATAAAGAAVAWLAVNVPIAVLARENWLEFFTLNSSRPADPDTIWNLALTATDNRLFDGPLAPGQTPSELNAVIAVGLVLLAAAVGWLALAAPVRPRVAQLAFLLVAGFLLVNKVWSPQYSLWLLPLAVLARPSWRALLLWQATEALLWVPRLLWYLGTDNKGVDVGWFFLAVGIRDVAVLVLVALVVRDVWDPARDLVRRSWPGTDDPAGGVLDGAADRFTLRRRPQVDPTPPSIDQLS